MTAYRLGIVGCGRLAELGYLPALRGVPGLRLVAVADPDLDRRQLLAERAGQLLGERPSTHVRLTEMLDRALLAAVVVASPPREHAADAGLASRAGVAALVEKPPASDAAGAEALVRLHHPPWIGFNRRFSGAASLRDALAGARRADLRLKLRYRRGSWRPVTVRDDALGDLAPHLVDLALWLGDAEAMKVRALDLRAERARIELTTTRGQATIACDTDRSHLELVEARVGTRHRRWREGGPVRNARARLRRGEHGLVASLRGQLLAYDTALRGGSPGRLAGAEDGLAVMRVIDAARESWLAGGEAVALAPEATIA